MIVGNVSNQEMCVCFFKQNVPSGSLVSVLRNVKQIFSVFGKISRCLFVRESMDVFEDKHYNIINVLISSFNKGKVLLVKKKLCQVIQVRQRKIIKFYFSH